MSYPASKVSHSHYRQVPAVQWDSGRDRRTDRYLKYSANTNQDTGPLTHAGIDYSFLWVMSISAVYPGQSLHNLLDSWSVIPPTNLSLHPLRVLLPRQVETNISVCWLDVGTVRWCWSLMIKSGNSTNLTQNAKIDILSSSRGGKFCRESQFTIPERIVCHNTCWSLVQSFY